VPADIRPALRPYNASPFIEARAKGRGRRSSAADCGPTQQRVVGSTRADDHFPKKSLLERLRTGCIEALRRRHGPREYPREVCPLDPRCRGEHVLFVILLEWDTHTFGATYLASPDTPASPLRGSEWCQKGFSSRRQGIMALTIYLQNSTFSEPTSGLEPLTCSLRVMHHALQGFAQACKFRISKLFSLLRLAVRCTVLRSRWCQSGVRSA
jgi:hypothetical protein